MHGNWAVMERDEPLALNEGPDRVEDSNPYEAGEEQDECPEEPPPVEPQSKYRRLGLNIGCLITDHSVFSSWARRFGKHNMKNTLAESGGECNRFFWNSAPLGRHATQGLNRRDRHRYRGKRKGERHQIAIESSIDAFMSLVLLEISRTRRGRHAREQFDCPSDSSPPGLSVNQSWHLSCTHLAFLSSVLMKGQILLCSMFDLLQIRWVRFSIDGLFSTGPSVVNFILGTVSLTYNLRLHKISILYILK